MTNAGIPGVFYGRNKHTLIWNYNYILYRLECSRGLIIGLFYDSSCYFMIHWEKLLGRGGFALVYMRPTRYISCYIAIT